MKFNNKILELAKQLKELAPDECITTISISKSVSGADFAPELTISHFEGGENPKMVNKEEFFKEGVDVNIRYFGDSKEGED